MIKGLTLGFLLLTLVVGSFVTSSGSIAQAQSSGLSAQLNSTDHEVDPGQKFGLTATIQNTSGTNQTNVVVKMRVTQNESSVDYVNGSTSVKYDGAVHNLQDSWVTNGQNFSIIATSKDAVMTWQMEVDDNADTGEWIQVSFEVWSDQMPDGILVYKNIYIGERTLNKDFTLSKTADRSTANPGDRINYTIKMKNTGDVALEDILIVEDLPNGDNKWVTYVNDSGEYDIDGTDKSLSNDWITRGFELNHLNPDQTLTITFSVTVRSDAPHGLVLNNIVNVKPQGYDDWAQAAANTTVHVPNLPTPTPITPTVQRKPLPKTGIGDAFMAVWFSAVSSLGAGAFVAGRKMILG